MLILQAAALQKPEMPDVVRWMIESRHAKRRLTWPRKCRLFREDRVEDHGCAVVCLPPHSKVTAKLLGQAVTAPVVCGNRESHRGGGERIGRTADTPPEMLSERSSQQRESARTTDQIYGSQ